ncbi:hypothetical protein SVIOM342S_00301 [Streptomyces violaceorubidus]
MKQRGAETAATTISGMSDAEHQPAARRAAPVPTSERGR